MAHPKIEHETVVTHLFETFRQLGYDGASLAQLAEVTGLKKASLYHRFPRGKDEMVEMVLRHVEEWIRLHITRVLQSDAPAQERLGNALQNIRALYEDGNKPCILRSLSVGTGLTLFQQPLERNFTALVEGFRDLAVSVGQSPEEASRLAENAVIRMQGALVLANAMRNPTVFQRTMAEIGQEWNRILIP